MKLFCKLSVCLSLLLTYTGLLSAEDLQLNLRSQSETSKGSGRYHRLEHKESWDPEQTAIIVCDVWDYHHCLNAVR